MPVGAVSPLKASSLLSSSFTFVVSSSIMGKKTKSKKKRGGSGGGKKSTERSRSASIGDQHHEQLDTKPYNFVSSAGPGCYIAHLPPTIATEDEAAAATASNDWLLDIEPFHPDDFDDDVEIPEIALDPYEHTVSVTNATSARRVCYVTVYDVTVLGRDGRALPPGISIDNDGNERECTTFIVLCPPTTFVHLGQLRLGRGQTLADVELDSDVRDYQEHPNPNDTHTRRIGFPLLCKGADDGVGSPDDSGNAALSEYLCSQGEGGHLTHYMTGNYHAIDFRCPVGTPCVAVCDGTVVECQDDNSLTGVAVGNLFKWNSISIRAYEHDDDGDEVSHVPQEASSDAITNDSMHPCTRGEQGGPLYLEYVHIQMGSICVKPGDRVKKGQVICRSGGVGFSPEPHLHFSAFRSDDPTAPTVRVWFEGRCDDGGCDGGEEKLFIPKAGSYYNACGEVAVDCPA